MDRQQVDLPPGIAQPVGEKSDDKADHLPPAGGQPGTLGASGQHGLHLLGAVWCFVESRLLHGQQPLGISQGAVKGTDH